MKKMKFTLVIAAIAISLVSCKKDKYTTAPQIKFNSFSPNIYTPQPDANFGPFLSIQLIDAEGDFGFSNADGDTSYIYVKNISIPPFAIDSLAFPANAGIKRDNLNAEVTVNLFYAKGIIRGTLPAPTIPYTDTLHFEVYVRDFANNKSNVITTPAFYLVTQ